MKRKHEEGGNPRIHGDVPTPLRIRREREGRIFGVGHSPSKLSREGYGLEFARIVPLEIGPLEIEGVSPRIHGMCPTPLSLSKSNLRPLSYPCLPIPALPNGACYDASLNDCHEKAECIPDGLRYKCQCRSGTIDINNSGGRNCEGIVVAQQ